MTFITDRKHCVSIAEDAINAIEAIAKAWLREDELACSPRSPGGTPTSGGSHSDTTRSIATGRGEGMVDQERYRDRDRIGNKLLALKATAEAEVAKHRPRHTGGACSCCETETATHGVNHEGRPAMCFGCWRFLKEHNMRCGPAVHDGRPKVRMCECGPRCCEVCPDRAADGRTVSERCKKRIQRDKAVA